MSIEVFRARPNHTFIETGTQTGRCIKIALELEYPQIISIEIDHNLAQRAKELFNQYHQVAVVEGDVVDVLWPLIEPIGHNITFWLDGHMDFRDPAVQELHAEGKTVDPILIELDIIARHPIKTHTIIIDDIKLYRKYGHIDVGLIQEKLLQINPGYKLSGHRGGKILAADP